MSDIEKQTEGGGGAVDVPVLPSTSVLSVSRRRLIKLGASAAPVVATLVSKPALAWHCQTPSAWGSLKANPRTSLAARDNLLPFPDECWSISDWGANSSRSSSGYSDPPWTVLANRFPQLKNVAANPKKHTAAYCNPVILTVAQLTTALAGTDFQTMANGNLTIPQLFAGASVHRSTIVAQLNFLLCAPLGNQMEVCLSPQATRNITKIPLSLQNMALRRYSPGKGIAFWSDATTIEYLSKNWMAS